MKITNYLIILFFAGIILASCTNQSNCSDAGKLLTNQIDYWVSVGSPVNDNLEDESLPSESREWLIDDLLQKAKDRELPVYYYLNDTLIPMDSADLAYVFFHVDTEYVEINGQYQKIPIEEKLDVDRITKFKFREQWYFNSKTNELTKKVIAVCPMVVRYKNVEEVMGYKGLFWIYLNN